MSALARPKNAFQLSIKVKKVAKVVDLGFKLPHVNLLCSPTPYEPELFTEAFSGHRNDRIGELPVRLAAPVPD
jgi:hypothetical protein